MGELSYFNRIIDIGSIINAELMDIYKDRLFARSFQEPNTGCWIWAGDSVVGGYGRIGIVTNKKGSPTKVLAHRLSYYLYYGDIKKGFVVHHKCNNPHCVNPMHLESVTQYENSMVGNSFSSENSRKTECPSGHPYSISNTRYNKKGRRECKICLSARALARYHKNKKLKSKNK